MQVLIFALITMIKLAHGGLLDSLLGPRNPSTGVNQDGIVHSLNPTLGGTLCTLGIGCKMCPRGALSALDPTLGDTVNFVGLGEECPPVIGGGGDDKEKHEKKPKPVTEPPVTVPPLTQPPVTQPDCFKIEKPFRNVKKNEITNGNGGGGSENDDNDWDECNNCFEIGKPIRSTENNQNGNADGVDGVNNNNGKFDIGHDDCGCDDCDD